MKKKFRLKSFQKLIEKRLSKEEIKEIEKKAELEFIKLKEKS